MCRLVVSVLDSPAVDPRSNPDSGSALLMSEKSQAVVGLPWKRLNNNVHIVSATLSHVSENNNALQRLYNVPQIPQPSKG